MNSIKGTNVTEKVIIIALNDNGPVIIFLFIKK